MKLSMARARMGIPQPLPLKMICYLQSWKINGSICEFDHYSVADLQKCFHLWWKRSHKVQNIINCKQIINLHWSTRMVNLTVWPSKRNRVAKLKCSTYIIFWTITRTNMFKTKLKVELHLLYQVNSLKYNTYSVLDKNTMIGFKTLD